MEIWNPVVNYEGLYEVSNLGNIKRIKGGHGSVIGRILKPYFNKVTGYCYIVLSKNCIQIQYAIHRLVAQSFLGLSELTVNHIDGDKTNNKLTNLEYLSNKDNLLHATEILKKRCGENHWNSKLTLDQVNEIRSLKDTGVTQQVIADKFNINRSFVSEIINRKKWANF